MLPPVRPDNVNRFRTNLEKIYDGHPNQTLANWGPDSTFINKANSTRLSPRAEAKSSHKPSIHIRVIGESASF